MSMYVPIPVFFGLITILIIFLIFAFRSSGTTSIILALLSTFISLYLSQLVVNGQLIENIGGFNRDTGEIVQGVTVIQIPALSYAFIFIALVTGGLMIYNIGLELQSKNNNEIELDF